MKSLESQNQRRALDDEDASGVELDLLGGNCELPQSAHLSTRADGPATGRRGCSRNRRFTSSPTSKSLQSQKEQPASTRCWGWGWYELIPSRANSRKRKSLGPKQGAGHYSHRCAARLESVHACLTTQNMNPMFGVRAPASLFNEAGARTASCGKSVERRPDSSS